MTAADHLFFGGLRDPKVPNRLKFTTGIFCASENGWMEQASVELKDF